MIRMSRVLSCVAMLGVVTPTQASEKHDGVPSTGMGATPAHVMVTPEQIQWGDAPPSLPRGAKFAVIEGDPAKEGPFTFRAKLPANYRILPHWHPGIEHVTVITGNFSMGTGEKFDEKAMHALPPGSFAVMQPKTPHFAMARGETVIQVHSIGPWGITYVNPKDDPRGSKAAR